MSVARGVSASSARDSIAAVFSTALASMSRDGAAGVWRMYADHMAAAQADSRAVLALIVVRCVCNAN